MSITIDFLVDRMFWLEISLALDPFSVSFFTSSTTNWNRPRPGEPLYRYHSIWRTDSVVANRLHKYTAVAQTRLVCFGR